MLPMKHPSEWIIDVSESQFEVQVLQRSQQVPVLVDFWAPWCGPCRTLGPILERMAQEMDGRFVLAKVNSDENPRLGQLYSVRGIPAVKLFVDGRVVNEFTGAQPESAVRQFLERALPSGAEPIAAEGERLEQLGDLTAAGIQYQDALAMDPSHDRSLLGMARVLIGMGRPDGAREALSRLGMKAAASPEARALQARLAFTGSRDDLAALQQQVAQQPDDLALRFRLGMACVGQEDYAAGMDQFLEIIRRDRTFDDGAARKAMVQVFELLGHGHPLVTQYRSRLSSVWFS